MLGTLQQKAYDQASEWCRENWTYVVNSEDELEEFLEGLKEDFSNMDAATLRHQMKVWRETE